MGSLSTLVNTVFKNVERTEWSYSGEWSVNSYHSRYHSLDFQVGGFPFNLLVNTKQETGSFSFHLQFQGQDTCFVNFKLGLVNTSAENNVVREKSFRFSSMDKISGWDDFVPNGSCHEDEGFLEHGCLKFMVSATVLGEVLIDDVDLLEDSQCYGTTTWKMFNFWSLNGHSEITSQIFMISKLSFRFCLSRTVDEQYLSFFVEIPSRDFEMEESIWALLEVSMSLEKTDPKSGQKSHKPLVKMDSPGRRLGYGHGCDTRLGWTEYITMSKFGEECNENDVVKFVLSFNAIEETVKPIGLASVKWNINNFSSLKNIMKKMEKKTVKKMKKETTGLCIESQKFCIHGRDFRLLLGLSQGLLSLFVEMLDLKDTSGGASLPFGCFCLSVISKKKNQDFKLKTHGRCSKKYVWGWSDLITLDHLFEESLGYLVQGTAVEFEVEVRILDETFTVEDEQVSDTSSHLGTRMTVKWEVKNFISFMKDKFIYSDYFQVDGCKLRIGVCRKVDKKDQKDEILFACLSTDPSDGLKKSYVRYTIKAVNQKDDSKSLSADNVDLNLHGVRGMMISGLTPSALFVCEIHHQLDTSTTEVGPSDRSASDILFTLKSARLKSKFLGNLCSGDEIAEEFFHLLQKTPAGKNPEPNPAILLPKLVTGSERCLLASALLAKVSKPDVEAALKSQVIDAIGLLKLDMQEWEHTLTQVSDGSSDKGLKDMIDFLFPVASKYECIAQAVRVVRKRIGSTSPAVLEAVSELLMVHETGKLVDQLKAEEKKRTREAAKSTKEIEKLEFENKKLSDEMKELTMTVENSERESGKLVDQLKAEEKKRTREAAKSTKEIEKLEFENKKLSDEMKELTMTVENSKRESKKLVDQLKAEEKKRAAKSTKEIEKLEFENKKLSDEMKELTMTFENSKRESGKLVDQLKAEEKKRAAKSTKEIEKLEFENKKLSDEMKELTMTVENSKREYGKLVDQLEAEEKKRAAKSTKEIEKLEFENKKLSDEMKELTITVENSKRESEEKLETNQEELLVNAIDREYTQQMNGRLRSLQAENRRLRMSQKNFLWS